MQKNHREKKQSQNNDGTKRATAYRHTPTPLIIPHLNLFR